MARKDNTAELAELRARLEEVELEAAQKHDEAEQYRVRLIERTSENDRLKRELEAAKAEIMRIKAHAYDLMMELEKAETA